jgi:flagellin-like hook-associated protein FlgL
MIISPNQPAVDSIQPQSRSRSSLAKSLARLTDGPRHALPADEEASLARSLKFAARITQNLTASANVEHAVHFSQAQEDLLEKVRKALDRMSELSELAQNTSADLPRYEGEFTQLQAYISDVTGKQFNGIRLFGSTPPALASEHAVPTPALKEINLPGPASIGVLNAYSGISISSSVAAKCALDQCKIAIQALANLRSQVTVNMQRLILTREQLSIQSENLSAAGRRIGNPNAAPGGADFALLNLLVQSGAVMLAGVPRPSLRLADVGEPTVTQRGS